MPYYTGSANDLEDMLSILAARLGDNGWTIHRNAASGDGVWVAAEPPGGGPRVWHWSTETLYSSQTADFPEPRLWLLASSSYDSGQGLLGQPDLPPDDPDQAFTNSWTAPFNEYHLFITSDYAHLVVRTGDGYWRHACAGVAESISATTVAYIQGVGWRYDQNGIDLEYDLYHSHAWDGNNFYVAAAKPNWVWASDTEGWRWMCDNTGQYRCRTATYGNRGIASTDRYSFQNQLYLRNPNDFNGLTVLLPVPLALEFGGLGSEAFRLYGWVRDVRVVNMENTAPGGAIQVGTEEWLVFPAMNKRPPNDGELIPASGNQGYAYRKTIA